MALKAQHDGRVWTWQPQILTRPRRSGPGANPAFLVSGNSFVDVVSGKFPTSPPAGTEVTPYGVSIAASSLSYPIAPLIGPEISIMYVGSGARAADRCDVFYQGLSSPPYTQFTIAFNSYPDGISDQKKLSVWGYDGGFNGTWTKAFLLDYANHVYIVTKDASGAISVYIDGALITPDASSSVTSWYAAGQTITYAAAASSQKSSLLAAWNRKLRPDEISALSGQPALVFAPRRTRRYISLGTVVAYYPGSDISVAGWTASTGTDLFACVDETTFDDGDYITSPDLTTGTVMGWKDQDGSPVTVPAGTWSLAIRPMFPEGTSGQIRLVMLDSGNSAVGTSAWQTLTGSFVTYTLAITTSGVSDRFRLEIQP